MAQWSKHQIIIHQFIIFRAKYISHVLLLDFRYYFEINFGHFSGHAPWLLHVGFFKLRIFWIYVRLDRLCQKWKACQRCSSDNFGDSCIGTYIIKLCYIVTFSLEQYVQCSTTFIIYIYKRLPDGLLPSKTWLIVEKFSV